MYTAQIDKETNKVIATITPPMDASLAPMDRYFVDFDMEVTRVTPGDTYFPGTETFSTRENTHGLTG